ncbi:hypothetical protein Sjap_024613 [Stephania japonica]|uniref:Large ribosomal RNA subunit accumulation protein YCED homolog 1, chloroplastic n=1 Tax=Stephania japonica TaxID=461633 RepID=A0AAP0EDP4_9MAGN
MAFVVLSPCPTAIVAHKLSSNYNQTLISNSPNPNLRLYSSNQSPLPLSTPHHHHHHRLLCRDATITNLDFEDPVEIDWGDEDMVGAPWEGAVVYRRDPTATHLEYCTTLERLGLGKVSSELSRSRASAMGMRVAKGVKEHPLGTPVLVSVDVGRRRKGELRLDGIVRTVLSLGCNRCGEPAAESVFSNFTLLLTEEPIEETGVIDMGRIFGEDKNRSAVSNGEEDDDDDAIDLDDRLYFPAKEKEIDISKQIRDLVHIEITINAICDPSCKGLCLKCSANLNSGVCICSRKQEPMEKPHGPLGNLREQLQKK